MEEQQGYEEKQNMAVSREKSVTIFYNKNKGNEETLIGL